MMSRRQAWKPCGPWADDLQAGGHGESVDVASVPPLHSSSSEWCPVVDEDALLPTGSRYLLAMPFETLATLLHDRAALSASDVALRHRVAGSWTDVTWGQLRDRADAIAAGLVTGPGGLKAQERVAILAETSADWVACDFAALSTGAQTVPIYTSLLTPEIGYVHVDTQVSVLIVGDADLYRKAIAIRDGFTFFDQSFETAQLSLRHVVVMDPSGLEPDGTWESLAELEARGADNLAAVADELVLRRRGVQPEELATFTYTSGTTGPPKAVMQTSANHLAIVAGTADIGILSERMRASGLFLFLPLAHSFGRLVQFAAPVHNLPLVLSSVPSLVTDLAESRPGFVPAAPRVYEKLRSGVQRRIDNSSPVRRRLASWAIGVGLEQATSLRDGGTPPSPWRRLLAERLVLRKVRAGLGLDRAEGLLSGAAPLQPEVMLFLQSLGLDVYEAYGLTETCPGLAANRPGAVRVGTVGQALPGVELLVADDGEILARGANITSGYLNREEDTKAVFDADGWFHTGDLGSIDADGFVTITGRKKELIKTSGGKYIAPPKIEGMLKLSPLVAEAVIVGEGRPYCIALLALDEEAAAEYESSGGTGSTKLLEDALESHVSSVNTGLASFETVKYWRLIDLPSVATGDMTASMKVKRAEVCKRWHHVIDDVYEAATDGRSSAGLA